MPLQEYPVNDGVHQGSIFGPTLLYQTLMAFVLSVLLLSLLIVLLSALSVSSYLVCDNN